MCPDSKHALLGILLTSQPLRNSTWPQGKQVARAKKKNFLVPKSCKEKEKESGSGQTGVRTNNDSPAVAKSPTQLTNNFMGIAPTYYHMREEIQKTLPLYTSGSQVLHIFKGSMTSSQGIYGYTSLTVNMKFTYFLIKGVMFC